MPFVVPMVWREPFDHVTDCYFCLTPKLSLSGLNKKKAELIEYSNLPSAIRPVPHDESMPVPKAPDEYNLLSDDEERETVHSPPEKQPRLISQGELNDLVRNLDLTKTKAEILGSRLQQWNLLDGKVKTSFRDRSKSLVSFFSMSNNNLVSCNDIHGLFEELWVPYNPSNRRLFIDASKYILKAVLLHNGNKLPSIPVGHAVEMKETYENVKQLLSDIKYDDHKWKICCDLKMVAIILGFQTGYTKYMRFLCDWDSRARSLHWEKKDWPTRESYVPGVKNVLHPKLVNEMDIIMPLLHIKLGLMKNFVKKLDRTGHTFLYLGTEFPKLSEAKIKEGVFVGPQIRELLKDKRFDEIIVGKEKAAWESFREVC